MVCLFAMWHRLLSNPPSRSQHRFFLPAFARAKAFDRLVPRGRRGERKKNGASLVCGVKVQKQQLISANIQTFWRFTSWMHVKPCEMSDRVVVIGTLLRSIKEILQSLKFHNLISTQFRWIYHEKKKTIEMNHRDTVPV